LIFSWNILFHFLAQVVFWMRIQTRNFTNLIEMSCSSEQDWRVDIFIFLNWF